MMTWLYIANFLLVASATAFWAVSVPRWLAQPALVRLLMGAALTPFVIGTLSLLSVALWPGLPSAVLLLLPGILSIWFLAVRRRTVRAFVRRAIRAGKRWVVSRDLIAILLALAAGFVLLRVGYVAFVGVQKPLLAHDALVYLNEALHFAGNRSVAAIPSFAGEPWDVIAGHPHGFLFQAFLAHALLAGSLSDPGFPNDVPARVAFQLTFFCMLLAISAAAALFKRRGSVSVALLLTFAVEPLQYISQYSSRDAFRVIPLISLAIALCVPLVRRFRATWGWAVVCGVLIAWSINAHSLNLFAVSALIIAAAFGYFRSGVEFRTVLHAGVAVMSFGLIASLGYAENFIRTGHPLGYGMYYRIYEGTPLAQGFKELAMWDTNGLPILQGIHLVFLKFGYPVSALAFVATLVGVCTTLLGKRRTLYVFLATYLAITLLLPLSGALDIGDVNLRGAMLSNFRYPFGSYVFLGIICAPVAAEIAARDGQRGSKYLALLGWALAVAIVGISVSTVRVWTPRVVPDAYLASMFPEVKVDPSKGERWITSDNRLSYYNPHLRPIFLYTKPAQPLLAASTDEEVWRILRTWNVRAVALDRHFPGWWPRTALHRALVASPNVKVRRYYFLDVYTIEAEANATASETGRSSDAAPAFPDAGARNRTGRPLAERP